MNDETSDLIDDAPVMKPSKNSWRAIGKRILRIIALSYLGIIFVLAWFESTLVYPAPNPADARWERTDLSYEDVRFESDDGTRLHGWYFPHDSPRAHIIFCHGNAQQVADLGDWANAVREDLEVSIFVFDYRGYGQSEGKPHESGILADGKAAQAWLAEREGISRDQMVLWGLSLGGGVAVSMAADHGAQLLILDRTFSSIVGVASSHYPWLPVYFIMRNRYPSAERIKNYDGPLLQLHGVIDEIVPFRSGEALFEASPSADKRFIRIETLRHNDPMPSDLYDAVDEALSRDHRELNQLPI